MKRFLHSSIPVLLSILLIACTFLTACHGSRGGSSFSMPDSLDTSKTIEITFWAKNDTNKAQTNVYENAIKEFEALYPNIKVNMRLYTDYSRIYNDVITNIATDSTPNVCITYPDHIATYLTGDNTVLSLDDLLTDSKYGLGGSELLFDSPTMEEIVPEFLNECYLNGQCYALPYMRSTEVCYINKTYVEKLGYEVPDVLTWDFIFEVSEAALAKDLLGNYKVNGQKVLIPFIYKSTDNMMISALNQLDAGYSTDSGEILIFNDQTREFLKTVSEHAKTGAFSTFKISSYPANFLNAGQCIFAIDSTAGSTWMGSKAPLIDISADQLVEFETVVRPIPQYDTENISMISQGPSICVFKKSDSQEVLASWLFAQFLLTNEVQIAYAETEGYVPVTLKAQNSTEYQEYLSKSDENSKDYYSIKIEATKLLLENTSNVFVTPVFNGSTSLRSAAGELIEEVCKGVRRKKTVDDSFIDELFSNMTSLYRLDQIESTSNETSSKDLGPLPTESIILIVILIAIWIIIGIAALIKYIKSKK